MSPREEILKEASELLTGEREQQYGHPSVNLQRIADYWNVYLDQNADANGDYHISPRMVAEMMILLKLARAAEGYKWDTYVDVAGYAALVSEVSDDA